MIDRLVRIIFSFSRLRLAIFSEVDLYNSVSRTIEDPYWGSTATAIWSEEDGWHGWTKTDTGYYFIDYPEPSLGSILDELHNIDRN